MIEFGKTLRLAREEKGYSISQLAEMTRMIHQTIEDLENENFTKIAAPIYGRGFVKLYCEAVGLDPKPMVAEFMEIFNGNRELGIKERTPSPAPEVKPAEEQPPAITAASPAPEPVASVPPPQAVINAFQPEQKKEEELPASKPKLSRYASPLREASLPSLPSIPPSVWRIAALGVGALLLLWLLAIGFKALYNATAGAEPAVDVPTETSTRECETAPETRPATDTSLAATTGANREKIEVPPLYVD